MCDFVDLADTRSISYLLTNLSMEEFGCNQNIQCPGPINLKKFGLLCNYLKQHLPQQVVSRLSSRFFTEVSFRLKND